MHRVLIELTPDEAREWSITRRRMPRTRLLRLADIADGHVLPRDTIERPAP